MTNEELLINYVNRNPHPREIGRYWATDVSRILKGYLTPRLFFNPKPIDLQGAKNIISGMAYESQLKEIMEANDIVFEYGESIKREIQLTPNITFVVKPDFETKDWVLETKYPVRQTIGIPEKWIYQLEAEYRSTKKPVYLGIFSSPFNITYYKYEPSDNIWQIIQDILIKFDKKVRLYAEKHEKHGIKSTESTEITKKSIKKSIKEKDNV